MRSLTSKQIEQIQDLDAEGALGHLPTPMVEKDIHLTDLLDRLSKLEVRHSHFKGLRDNESAIDDGIELIFCGGTSLSKAHNLIQRMSEDADIKVVLSAPDPSQRTPRT